MKKQKRILSLLLAAVIMLTMCVPAFAANIADTGASLVEHAVDVAWAATIPAYVVPEEQGQQIADYSVTLENTVIPDGQQLTTVVEYSGTLTEQNGVELPYKLYDESGNEIQSGSQIMTQTAGTPDDTVTVAFGAALTAKAKYAGVYTDTATFTFDVAEKVYTAEEIAADPLLYGIGKTKPEYVVAKFSQEYSTGVTINDHPTVTIFKNGEESDGIMMDFTQSLAQTNSPMNKLVNFGNETVIIEEGVTNIGDYFFQTAKFCDLSISASVSDIGQYSLWGLRSKNINVADANASYCSIDGVLFTKDKMQLLRFPSQKVLDSYEIPSSVTAIYPFAFSTARVANIIVPEKVDSIGERAFGNAYGLNNISVSDQNPNYKSIDGVLFTKDETTLIVYPAGRKGAYTIPETTTQIEELAFSDSVIEDVTIPGTVREIPYKAFSSCMRLKKVAINEGVKTIGDYAFENCGTSSVGGNNFYVNISSSVTSIAKSAFNAARKPKVYAQVGSYAESWATENGYTFVAQ